MSAHQGGEEAFPGMHAPERATYGHLNGGL